MCKLRPNFNLLWGRLIGLVKYLFLVILLSYCFGCPKRVQNTFRELLVLKTYQGSLTPERSHQSIYLFGDPLLTVIWEQLLYGIVQPPGRTELGYSWWSNDYYDFNKRNTIKTEIKRVPCEEYLRQCMFSSLPSGQSTEPSQNLCMGRHSPSLHLAVFHWHKLPFSPG